jgi:glycosyltransferase involved in cell wall biosynthesis
MLHNYLIWRGGAERLLFTLSQHLKRLGFEVDVYGIKYDPNECFPELTEGFQVGQAARIYQSRPFRVLPVLQAKGMANLLDSRYDIIHAHNFPANITALFASRKSGVPFIWQCNEPPRIIYDADEQRNFVLTVSEQALPSRILALGGHVLQKFTSKPFDWLAASAGSAITTLSRFTASWIKNLYERDSLIIPPGVDTNIFHPDHRTDDIRSRHRVGNAPFLLSVARLWKAKNLHSALIAFKFVLREIPNARYVIIGNGPERAALINLARELNLFPNVEFLEDPPPSEVPRYYCAADLFVLPAIREPWGLSTLEAMASGTPVIVSNEGGFPDYVKHNVTGMLVDPRSPIEQAKAIVELLSNRARLNEMGKEASKSAGNYTWKKMAGTYAELYRTIIHSEEHIGTQ